MYLRSVLPSQGLRFCLRVEKELQVTGLLVLDRAI